MTITKKMEKVTLNLNNARVAECEAINESAKKFVSKNIAECKKVAGELRKCDSAYAKASENFTKQPTVENKYALDNAKVAFETCINGYNTLVNNINKSLADIKVNYAKINEYVNVVDTAEAVKRTHDYENYSEKVSKTMAAIAKSLKNCKSVQK